MGDLFGEWVPDEWIKQVFDACEEAPQHKYLFLTKNPIGLKYPFHTYFTCNQNWWMGTSICCQEDTERVHTLIGETTPKTKRFLSIEPLLGEVDLRCFLMTSGWVPSYYNPDNSMGEVSSEPTNEFINWVIIGQQTGPGAVPPKPEWVKSIIDQCKTAGVPVFVKSPLYQQFPIQEWPEGLK
jgi:protein gp37